MRCTLLCIGILQPHVFVIFTLGLEGLHGEKHPRANNLRKSQRLRGRSQKDCHA